MEDFIISRRFNFSFAIFISLVLSLFFSELVLNAREISPHSYYNQQVSYSRNESEKLRNLAVEEGEVKVIVNLDLAIKPEGKLSKSAFINQRNSIQSVQSKVFDALENTEHSVSHRYRTIPAFAANLSPEAVEELKNHPSVKSFQLDIPEEPHLNESIPHIGADDVIDKNIEGEGGGLIAILDTGIDTGHPVFEDRVVEEACFSSGEDRDIATGGDCPGGGAREYGPGSGAPIEVNGKKESHGTHVGGIAAGASTSELGPGVAPSADLASIMVFYESEVEDGDNRVFTWISDQIAALEHVLDLNSDTDVAAVNMSLGGGLYSDQRYCDDNNIARKEIIDNLRSEGIATISSSGNWGKFFSNGISAPACISSAIAVGSTAISSEEEISEFSSQHPEMMDIVAPGSSIKSAVVGEVYEEKSGTSMAAPHVAGAWALIKDATGEKSVDQIEEKIIQTGVPIVDDRYDDAENNIYRSIRVPEFFSSIYIRAPFPNQLADTHSIVVEVNLYAIEEDTVEFQLVEYNQQNIADSYLGVINTGLGNKVTESLEFDNMNDYELRIFRHFADGSDSRKKTIDIAYVSQAENNNLAREKGASITVKDRTIRRESVGTDEINVSISSSPKVGRLEGIIDQANERADELYKNYEAISDSALTRFGLSSYIDEDYTIKLPVDPSKIDNDPVKLRNLEIYRLDEDKENWTQSNIDNFDWDNSNNDTWYVTAEVSHFSTFTIMGYYGEYALTEFIVGPNPFRASDHDYIMFDFNSSSDGLFEIEVYTTTGRKVFSTSTAENFYRWYGATDIASGFYIYRILDTETGQEKTGKLGIIR